MATLKIEEIHVTSRGGWPIVLTGIDPDPNHRDCIIGTIATPARGVIPGEWDTGGIFGNGTTPDDSLDLNDQEVQELIELVQHLRRSQP